MLRCLIIALLISVSGRATAQEAAEPQSELAYIPPYPGQPPVGFASAQDYIGYGKWRERQLQLREHKLIELGRPPRYTADRVGASFLVGTGAAMAAASLSIWYLDLSHDGGPLSRGTKLGFGLVSLAGASLMVGGIIWLRRLRHANPYQDEITALRDERRAWKQQMKRATQSLGSATFPPGVVGIRF